MSRQPTAVVYGLVLNPGDMEWPGRNQVMACLSEHVPVVLLIRRGRRSLVDLRRPRLERSANGLYLLEGALATRYSLLGRRFPWLSAWYDGRLLRSALSRAGFDDHVLWLTVNDPLLARGTGRGRLIYDCMDPNFLPDGQAEFDRSEFALASDAAVVFASAATLFERMKKVNEATYMLQNAAPAVALDPIELDASPRTAKLRSLNGPIVGYLGTIDWRFDASYVGAAARALPDVNFVMGGRINDDQREKIAPLRELENLHFLGQLDRREGDAVVKTFDVGLIPFTPSEMNDAINPVKMFLYLSLGLPVVSTDVAECRANPFVSVGDSIDSFTRLVADAARERDPAARQARVEYAAVNTWADRAESALAVLRERGVLTNGHT